MSDPLDLVSLADIDFVATEPLVPALSKRRNFDGSTRHPECYGSPMWFDATGRGCDTCSHRASCEKLAEQLRPDYLAGSFKRFGTNAAAGPKTGEQKERAARFREWFRRKEINSRARNTRKSTERRREARLQPEAGVEKEFTLRLRRLQLATKHAGASKRLQQLRGREEHVAIIWKVAALAKIRLGRAPSNAQLARAIADHPGAPANYNRDKVQTARNLIKKLEADSGPWEDFAKGGSKVSA